MQTTSNTETLTPTGSTASPLTVASHHHTQHQRFAMPSSPLSTPNVPNSNPSIHGTEQAHGTGLHTKIPHTKAVGNLSAPAFPGEASIAPTLLKLKSLPGPMSMNILGDSGTLHRLDDINAYLSQYADTLFGRGIIMANLVPPRATACAGTAAWVWLGGEFPETVDVISTSHYRTLAYGRKVHSCERNACASEISNIAGLNITTPARTAVDIVLASCVEIEQDDKTEPLRDMENMPGGMGKVRHACAAKTGTISAAARENACALIQEYHFDPADCLHILEENRFWSNSGQAKEFFKTIRYCF